MIILVLILFLNATAPTVFADNKSYFAQILFEQVYIYRTPNDDNSITNIFFEIPKTYFVELLDSVNQNFYLAKYLNITGYVKKESVQAVENTPSYPFLNNLNFRVYADLSRNIHSEPNASSKTSNIIASVPLYCRNLTYYGKITGETLIEGRTNTWFYCKYTADKDYYGYIYSDFCDELPTPMPTNLEAVTFIANPTFKLDQVEQNNSIDFNSNTTAVIIAIVSIPALIFVFMIIKNKNILNSKLNKEIKEY